METLMPDDLKKELPEEEGKGSSSMEETKEVVRSSLTDEPKVEAKGAFDGEPAAKPDEASKEEAEDDGFNLNAEFAEEADQNALKAEEGKENDEALAAYAAGFPDWDLLPPTDK